MKEKSERKGRDSMDVKGSQTQARFGCREASPTTPHRRYSIPTWILNLVSLGSVSGTNSTAASSLPFLRSLVTPTSS